MWPATTTAWLAVLAIGLGPAGAAFYLWDHAVKRGDIRALGALCLCERRISVDGAADRSVGLGRETDRCALLIASRCCVDLSAP